MRSKNYFSPSEWQVLEYIIEHHPITVRDVAAHFGEAQGWARTTTLTLMERLREKGYLERRAEGGINRYSPAEPKAEMQRGLIAEFVRNALGGSISPLMSFIGQHDRLSDQELIELRRMVDEMQARRQEETE